MSDNSAIEWTDSTWNPIRALDLNTGKIGWHCEHATIGCEFCYAEGINKRLGTGLPFKPGHREHVKIFLDEKTLLAPVKWKRPRKIFVGSMTDLFADFVTDDMLDKILAVMALCPQHTFQVLTKRAARMRSYFCGPWTGDGVAARVADATWPLATRVIHEIPVGPRLESGEPEFGFRRMFHPKHWPLSNVWLGVSCERQQEADERIPLLLQTPASVRFTSAEPLLGPIDLIGTFARYQDTPGRRCAVPLGRQLIDWVIVGGESGPNARPMHPDWARSLRDQCAAAGLAYFFKQHGEWLGSDQLGWLNPDRNFDGCRLALSGDVVRVGKKAAGRLLDGRTHDEFPAVYNAQDDFAKSRDVGFAAIRERVAGGGLGWEPK